MTGLTLAFTIVFLLAIIEVFASLAKDKPLLSFAGVIIAFIALLKVIMAVI